MCNRDNWGIWEHFDWCHHTSICFPVIVAIEDSIRLELFALVWLKESNWWWFWLHLYSELTHVFSLTSAFNQHTFSLHLCTHILSLPLHSINTLIWPLLHSINTLFWPPLHLISTLFDHLCIQSTHCFDHFCIQSIHYFDHLCIQSTRILTMFMSVQLVSAILETLCLPPLQEDHNQFLMETVISSHWRP